MGRIINLIAREDERILLVKEKDFWVLPGGNLLEREAEVSCLKRNFSQKLPNVEITHVFNYYKLFKGGTPNPNVLLRVEPYFGKIKGSLEVGEGISDAEFIKDFKKYNLSDMTWAVIKSLKSDNYL